MSKKKATPTATLQYNYGLGEKFVEVEDCTELENIIFGWMWGRVMLIRGGDEKVSEFYKAVVATCENCPDRLVVWITDFSICDNHENDWFASDSKNAAAVFDMYNNIVAHLKSDKREPYITLAWIKPSKTTRR